MTMISVSELRNQLHDIGAKVAYRGERIGVENHRKPYFAIVSIDDLKLLEFLEDKIDLEMAREALKRNDFVPWEKAKKELGL